MVLKTCKEKHKKKQIVHDFMWKGLNSWSHYSIKMQDIHIDNEFLTSIKTSIEKMPRINQLEVFRILKSNKSIKLNENKSGVFVNISFLSKEILQQLNEYVKYVQDQECVINNIETQKQEFKNTFF
jgi:hypothetical protein